MVGKKESSEKSANGEKTEYETLHYAKLSNGNVTVKKGRYGVFLEVSKKSGETWYNVRLDGLDVSVVRRMLDKFEAECEAEETRQVKEIRERDGSAF